MVYTTVALFGLVYYKGITKCISNPLHEVPISIVGFVFRLTGYKNIQVIFFVALGKLYSGYYVCISGY